MQTLTFKNLVQVVDYQEIDVKIELPAYYKDRVTGGVFAIAEDNRIMHINNMRNYYHLTVYEEGDKQYEFKLKEVTKLTPTTEDHFFHERDKLFKKLL